MSAASFPPAVAVGRLPIREALFRELAEDRREVRESSETRATCLVGVTDVGKAWVVETALREAEHEGWETLLFRGERDAISTPLSLFRGALASWHPVDRASSDEGAPSEGAPAMELPTLVVGMGMDRIPESERETRAAASVERYERLVQSLADPSQTAMEKRARLLTEVRTFLTERAKVAPLVLALQELHLADAVSADFVAVLLEWRTSVPIWLLVSYNAEEELYPPLRRALERTFLSRVSVRRPLGPLSSGELRLFLLEQWATKVPVPGAVLDEIIARARGMPGVALRLARSYQTQGALPDEEGTGAKGATSDVLAHLTEEQERAVALAAVVGGTVGFELLRRAEGAEEEKMAEVLEEIVQRGLLTEKLGGNYEFADEELRDRVYAGLTQARRRVLHRRVAEALEGLPGTADAARIFALAHHCARGRLDEKALQYLTRAVELARGAGSLPRERELLREMLTVHQRSRPKDHRGEALLLHELGSVAYAVGADEEAAQALARARDLLENLHETGRVYAAVLLDLARVTARRGDNAIADRLAEEALEDYRTVDDLLGVAGVLRFRSRIAYGKGQYESAFAGLSACLEALEKGHAPPVEIGRTLTAMSDVGFMMDHARRSEEEARLEQGIKLLQEGGDPGGALFAILGKASMQCALKDRSAFEGSMARVPALLPGTPEAWRLQESLLRKGALHVAKGELPEALGHAQVAADLARLLGDPEREARAHLFAADAAGRMGDTAKGEQEAGVALELGRAIPAARVQSEALMRLAMASQLRGKGAEARERLAQAELLARGEEISRTAQMIRRELRDSLSLEPGKA